MTDSSAEEDEGPNLAQDGQNMLGYILQGFTFNISPSPAD